jgi:hypothetical protein
MEMRELDALISEDVSVRYLINLHREGERRFGSRWGANCGCVGSTLFMMTLI